MAKASRVLISSLLLAWPATASAQDLAGDVVQCGEIRDAAARLRCFDALLPQARKSDAEREAEAAARARQEFGLNATQRERKVEGDRTPSPAPKRVAQADDIHVEAKIAGLDVSRYGTVFVLDNGQVWQTTSFGELYTVPRIGQKVTIELAGLGGYRLTLDGKTHQVGVKRLR